MAKKISEAAQRRSEGRTVSSEHQKTYFGDACYAHWEYDQIVLTTEYGGSETNRIYIDPDAWDALVRFVKRRGAVGR